VKFQCCNFTGLKGGTYDIVVIASVYHFLRKAEREELRNTIIRRCLSWIYE
jgi:hypothetical protein